MGARWGVAEWRNRDLSLEEMRGEWRGRRGREPDADPPMDHPDSFRNHGPSVSDARVEGADPRRDRCERMSASQLVRMTVPVSEGWDNFVGTFWVLARDGRTLRHTTERQTQLKVTLKQGADWREFFELAK